MDRAIRLTTLIERLGATLLVDEAVALGLLVLVEVDVSPSRTVSQLLPAGVLLLPQRRLRIVSAENQERFLQASGPSGRALQQTVLGDAPTVVSATAGLVFAALAGRALGSGPQHLRGVRPDVPEPLSLLIRRCIRGSGPDTPEQLTRALLPFVLERRFDSALEALFTRAFASVEPLRLPPPPDEDELFRQVREGV